MTEIYSKKPVKTGGQYKLGLGLKDEHDDSVGILPELNSQSINITPLNGGGPSGLYGGNTGVNTRSNQNLGSLNRNGGQYGSKVNISLKPLKNYQQNRGSKNRNDSNSSLPGNSNPSGLYITSKNPRAIDGAADLDSPNKLNYHPNKF